MTSSKTQKPLDSDTVRQLADILNETDLTEIEYEVGDAKIRVARQITTSPAPVFSSLPYQGQFPQPQGGFGEHSQSGNLALQQNTGQNTGQTSEAPTANADADPAKHPGAVKSPMVGNAYRSPAPGADVFVNEGDAVKAGDSVLIIEAMKVMNQIKAHKDGVVKSILVNDGDPVEFDEVLLIIE